MKLGSLRHGTLYALSATLTGLLFHAADAGAVYWEEVTAAACTPISGSEAGISFGTNGSVGGTGTLACPLEEESDHPGPANAIDVYVRDDASGVVSAQACATVFGPTGEFCGTPAETSSNGWKILHPDPGFYWTVYGFYYLRVVLHANPGNSRITCFVAKY